MTKLTFVLIFLFIFAKNSVKSEPTGWNGLNEPFVFNSTLSKFPMNTRAGRIPVSILKNFNLSGALLRSTSTAIFDAKYIEFAGPLDAANSTVPDGYQLGYVYIDANLVGKQSLEVVYFKYVKNHQNQIELVETIANHTVIVTTPSTVLDLIMQIYGIAFGVTVSTFMGILLDIKTILKIVKTPVPVVIGTLAVGYQRFLKFYRKLT
jgi:hypothetical protein